MSQVWKEVIAFVLQYVLRWIFSNEKNTKALNEIKKKIRV